MNECLNDAENDYVCTACMYSRTYVCHAGHFSNAISPAGKASRHLSGCGSQPELPLHAFSSFAAGKPKPPRPSSRLASSRQSSPLSDQPFMHVTASRAGSPSPEAPLLRDQASLTAVDRRSASTDRLISGGNRMESSTSDAAAGAATGHRTNTDAEMERQPALWPRQESCSLAAGTASAFDPLWPPPASAALPVNAASRDSDQEPGPSTGQAIKRKVSAHFGGQSKRHRSAEAEELPVRVSPHGLLGGLVGKLNPKQAYDASCDSSADDSISVDLQSADSGHPEKEDVSVAADDASDDADQNNADLQVEAIAGLEHVQPFASIANVAVGAIAKAASLKKFGMAESQKPMKHRHAHNVLQPFAPPRRCTASQEGQPHAAECTHGAGSVAPALQKFACLVGPIERSQTST